MANFEKVNPNASIYIFDDDTNNTGRSDEVAALLNSRGILTDRIRTYHSGLKPAFDDQRINTKALFVMDSIIVEPFKETVTFGQTIPFVVGRGVDPLRIIPSSSGYGGYENNEVAIIMLERLSGHTIEFGQTDLMEGINSMDPETSAERIVGYYEYLNKTMGEGNGFLR